MPGGTKGTKAPKKKTATKRVPKKAKAQAKRPALEARPAPATLTERVDAEWSDPAATEALVGALAASEDEAAEAIAKLVLWGARTHADNPETLWITTMRSPLRAALHLVARAGLGPNEHAELYELLWEHAGSTAQARRAL